MDDISKLKIILRGGDFNATAYQCLIIKSESTAVVLSGFEAADSSKYFRRLAQRYRPNNSGVLEG